MTHRAEENEPVLEEGQETVDIQSSWELHADKFVVTVSESTGTATAVLTTSNNGVGAFLMSTLAQAIPGALEAVGRDVNEKLMAEGLEAFNG